MEERRRRRSRSRSWRWILSVYYVILVVPLAACVITGGLLVVGIVLLGIELLLTGGPAGSMSVLWYMVLGVLGTAVGAISSMAMVLITRHVTEALDNAQL